MACGERANQTRALHSSTGRIQIRSWWALADGDGMLTFPTLQKNSTGCSASADSMMTCTIVFFSHPLMSSRSQHAWEGRVFSSNGRGHLQGPLYFRASSLKDGLVKPWQASLINLSAWQTLLRDQKTIDHQLSGKPPLDCTVVNPFNSRSRLPVSSAMSMKEPVMSMKHLQAEWLIAS